jgi:hypothetical protein
LVELIQRHCSARKAMLNGKSFQNPADIRNVRAAATVLQMGVGGTQDIPKWKSSVALSSVCGDGSRGTGRNWFTLKLETGAGH